MHMPLHPRRLEDETNGLARGGHDNTCGAQDKKD